MLLSATSKLLATPSAISQTLRIILAMASRLARSSRSCLLNEHHLGNKTPTTIGGAFGHAALRRLIEPVGLMSPAPFGSMCIPIEDTSA